MLSGLGAVLVRRARLVLVSAFVLIVVAAALGLGAFGKLQNGGQDDPHSESVQAQNLIDKKFGGQNDLVFLVHARTGTVDSPAISAAGARLTRSLAGDKGVSGVQSYWPGKTTDLRSQGGRDALVLVRTNGGDDANSALIDRYARSTGAYTIKAGGDAGFNHDIGGAVGRSLGLAEAIAVPILLVLLLFVFGSLVSALLPLVIGGIAILGTFAELSLLADVTNVSIFAINLTTGLGLGLGIDYGLLLVSRYRERLAAGDPVEAAVRHTVTTAGRTIGFSAATVAVALAALLVFPQYFLRSFAYAGIGVVVIAALAAVLVTPALLAVLGHRVNSGKLPWFSPARSVEAPIWGRIAAAVMRHPARTALPVVALLVVLAIPLGSLHFGSPDDRVLRSDVAARQVGDTLRTEFGGAGTSEISVVTTAPLDRAATSSYARTLSQLHGVSRVQAGTGQFVGGHPVGTPAQPGLSRPDGALFVVDTRLDPASSAAQDLVRGIRDVPAPGEVGTLVGGDTALLVDNNNVISSRLTIAIPMIALSTFVLLFLFTGSVVQPLRALVLSALSLSATLGVVVWVFQHGHLSGLLGFTPMPTDTAMTVLLFCVAFGLSMDYEVFVTSRIKELHDAGADTAEAVRSGLARTGRLVTAAASLLAVSFFAFLVGSVNFLQLFGLGAGLAILIDATLVRAVLVPAVMRILGPHAWYAPRLLRRARSRLALRESPAGS
jgi:RND superfamily putative drug exporter